jgi:ferritin-like metal-binding protein YciE
MKQTPAAKSKVSISSRLKTTPKPSNGNGKNGHSHASNGRGLNDKLPLEKLFHDELKDIYWVEKHLTKALPKMMKAATSEDLKAALGKHLTQTENHVSKVEQVFELLDKKPQGKKCIAMDSLTEEGMEVVNSTDKGTFTRDVAIIMSCQKVEHYEISSYGSLAQLALTLGKKRVSGILSSILEEEKNADEILTEIAESYVNQEATEEVEMA